VHVAYAPTSQGLQSSQRLVCALHS
jgi:hypothetical protein